jgi:exodeoxyribonuclease V alpha subunit
MNGNWLSHNFIDWVHGHSQIISNAHRIRQGQMPQLRGSEPNSDFHFVERDEPEAIVTTLIRLVQERIPKGLGFEG